MTIFYLLSEFLPEICWEEVAEEIFVHIFVLRSDLLFEPSNKPLHYLLDHDDFFDFDKLPQILQKNNDWLLFCILIFAFKTHGSVKKHIWGLIDSLPML